MAGTYTIRTTQPTGNLPEYTSIYGSIRPAWNSCILGNSSDGLGQPGANVLFNCTGYSQGRLIEMHNEIYPNNQITSHATNIYSIFSGDAQTWYQAAIDAGFSVGSVPKEGAVGVYYNPSYGSNGIGHVVNIEQFNANNGRWEISEGHWLAGGTYGSWDYSYLDSNYKPAFMGGDPNYQVLGFIYPFDNVTPGPSPSFTGMPFIYYLKRRPF